MQLFCNFSFVLFFRREELSHAFLFSNEVREIYFTLLYFTFLFFVYLNAVLGEFFPTKPEFWRNLLFDLLLFLMVEKALVFVCIDI